MTTYSEQDKARMLRYPIVSVLKLFGKRTDHQGCLYYSPFRDEKFPSLHIDVNKNLWNDFGEGSGGNVFTMVSRLKGLHGGEAWDFLAGLDPNIIPEDTYRPAAKQKSSRIIIDEIGTAITRGYLIRYACSRGIPEGLLQRYCSQVTYHIEGFPASRYTVIGFPSGVDGWNLRRASNDPRSKRCTSASFTGISPTGNFTMTGTSNKVAVFEGFFDFLSWQLMHGGETPGCDVCVLNSVTNIDRAMDFILAHDTVGCWMDNDEAGRKAFDEIMERAAGCTVIDHTPELGPHKDVNEFLMAHMTVPRKDIISNNTKSKSLTL